MKAIVASLLGVIAFVACPAHADDGVRWIKVQHAGIEAEIPEFMGSGSVRALMVNSEDTGTAYEPEAYSVNLRIYRVPPRRPAEFLDALFGKERATYRVDKPGLGVLSGYRGKDIFYAICRPGAGALRCIDIVYPAVEKAKYDPITTRIAHSFRR